MPQLDSHRSGHASQGAPLRILVASDEVGLREQRLLAGLRRRGFEVETLGTAADLYRQLFRASYDIILIDTVLPDENGYSVAARLRCVRRIGVEMLATLFELFGSGDEEAGERRQLDLDRVAEHLRVTAALADTPPDPGSVTWRHPDTSAQVLRTTH
jgi:CheY-like chemotaxis protein